VRILALDLSKRAAGFASWAPGDAVVASGVWALGSEFTSRGTVFCRLHQAMSDLNRCGTIDAVFYERPRHLEGFNNQSDAETHALLVGLAMHAESWGEAMGCRHIREVPMASWRRRFLDRPKRGTKSADLKDMAMAAARGFGFKPAKHDEAEAIGILDWAADQLGLDVPWRGALPLEAA
jgi:hypothetical protein